MEKAKAVLSSGFGSFEEYRDCANQFFEHGELQLAEEAIVESIQTFSGRPGEWNFKYAELVASFLQTSIGRVDVDASLKESLKVLAKALEASEDSLERFANMMNLNPSLQSSNQLREMAERVATTIMLVHDGGDFGLVRVASFFRRGFTEWNPSQDNSQRGKRETAKLGRSILNGILARNKADLVARTVRASIHADLGNLTDANDDIEYVLAAEKPTKYASLAGARIFYLNGDGFRSWDTALPVFEKDRETSVYGMLVTALAVAIANDPDSPQINTMRNFLDSMTGLVSKERSDWRGRQILEKNIGLNLLIREQMFGYAYVYLSELEREGWGGSTQKWATTLRVAAHAAGRDPQIEAHKLNPKMIDMFPDWHLAPSKRQK